MSGSRRGGLIWPTVATVVSLAILLGLGAWQWQRKLWKDGLIQQIAARTTGPAMPLAEALSRAGRGEDLEYARVEARGRWLSASERHYWAPGPQGPGWHVYAPLITADGTIVIVNRGLVPDALRDASRRPEPTDSEQRLTGLLRRPEARTTFTPDNDAVRNIWYWRDLEGMARSMLAGRAGSAAVAPFFLEAEAGSAPPPAPQGGVTRLDLPNSHLQYALTWWGLAATLLGVYVAFAWTRLAGERGRADHASQG